MDQQLIEAVRAAAKAVRKAKPRSKKWDDKDFRAIARQVADVFLAITEETGAK